ncbi:MAG: hypothetical protein JO349_08020 [Candidatus Eremiobacteraeota bacterium]|nr:hypothetical protein [Candidatus Eremiobacteraeota bacterium]
MSTRFFRLTAIVALVLTANAPLNAQYVGKSPAELGKVQFSTSCSPAVQDEFVRGVALLHSFWWSEGEKAFKSVIARDPSCAIAQWGLASIYMNNPFGTPPAVRVADGQAALDRAGQIPAQTQRERDYVDAVTAYYQDYGNRTEPVRQSARAKAYAALAAKYPNDDEAKIFAALYLASSQPLADQTYASRRQAAQILEQLWTKYPDHPGVAHYLIHCYDEPQLADIGIRPARRYSDIAPAAPHAQHMPSHIFTRIGVWKDSVESNRRAAFVAIRAGEPGEAMHATDFQVYALLQMARDGDARAALRDARQVDVSKVPTYVTPPYALAAIPARIAVERGAWGEAAGLEVVSTFFPPAEATTRFARALGFARSGNAGAAKLEVDQIVLLRDKLLAAKNAYWAGEVEVMRLSSLAWIALGEKRSEDAVAIMRQAADMEDKSEKASLTPARILPARELLADLLLDLKRPADALKEYEASQLREPNRLRGLYGAAVAAELSGNSAKARDYYKKVVAMAGSGDPRPELITARAYLSTHSMSS